MPPDIFDALLVLQTSKAQEKRTIMAQIKKKMKPSAAAMAGAAAAGASAAAEMRAE